MSVYTNINDSKCCVVDIAHAYVKAKTYGDDTPVMLEELILLNGYVKTLERYDHDPKKKVHVVDVYSLDGVVLSDGDNILSLGKHCSYECVDPEEVNCLTRDEICSILEQISLKCENCQCGC